MTLQEKILRVESQVIKRYLVDLRDRLKELELEDIKAVTYTDEPSGGSGKDSHQSRRLIRMEQVKRRIALVEKAEAIR